MTSFDYVIVGAGIVGLTVARELSRRQAGRILILEKEPFVGAHASGRNSGVIHAGIYYPAGSMKAKFCVEGARRLRQYVQENQLPLLACGKVIVAKNPQSTTTLSVLLERAAANGVNAQRISLDELRHLEPEACSHDFAIWSPDTAVIDSKAVLKRLTEELVTAGVTIAYGEEALSINPFSRVVKTSRQTCGFGFLFNCAGAYADRIAHQFGVGLKFRLLPFKGLYWQSTPTYAQRIQRLIYPAPDIHMPFLGVHITRTVDGKVLFGPTAIPALGRENYSFLGGLDWRETPAIGWHLLRMLARNPGNFRSYVRDEISRYLPSEFFKEAQSLVGELSRQDIAGFYKVGIRPQLVNLESGELEMDFKIEPGANSLHVLNAISPAFTSAFAFAPYLVDFAEKSKTAELSAPNEYVIF